jgi:hypothetical protein
MERAGNARRVANVPSGAERQSGRDNENGRRNLRAAGAQKKFGTFSAVLCSLEVRDPSPPALAHLLAPPAKVAEPFFVQAGVRRALSIALISI